MSKKTPTSDQKPFKTPALTGLNKQAAKKAKIARQPLIPNRDLSMRGGNPI